MLLNFQLLLRIIRHSKLHNEIFFSFFLILVLFGAFSAAKLFIRPSIRLVIHNTVQYIGYLASIELVLVLFLALLCITVAWIVWLWKVIATWWLLGLCPICSKLITKSFNLEMIVTLNLLQWLIRCSTHRCWSLGASSVQHWIPPLQFRFNNFITEMLISFT